MFPTRIVKGPGQTHTWETKDVSNCWKQFCFLESKLIDELPEKTFLSLFRHKPRQLIVEYCSYLHRRPTYMRYLFQVVHTQTTTARQLIELPTLGSHIRDIIVLF
jgi:hypothetical protein